ncbi:unnamed protein product [Paramecium pentaurelia]|uniref:Uncharacterized protein n=1 Tax=Paramecium pentaurelia TaxID=43138 RepID=A0A8S1WL88_9CILI|nr:unnamed protein product [Paramecium pentaurelia]
MDTENKKIEDRLVQSINQTINKLWIDYNSQSENILQEYKKEIKHRKNELFKKISQIRKNYNLKLNEISDKLIQEQFQSISKPKQSNQIKTISIQTLQDEQLLKDLKQLVEKEKVNSNQTITTLKNKDSIFQKEIENHLESLKQYDQLDIQQSIDILKEIPIERNEIVQLQEVISQISKIPSTNDNNYQDQVEFIKNIQEFIDQAKKYQCQINLFDQTITLFQQHTNNIDQIQSKIQNQFQINKNKYNFNIRIYQNYQMIILQHLIIKLNKLRNIVIFLNQRWIQQNQMNQIKIQNLKKQIYKIKYQNNQMKNIINLNNYQKNNKINIKNKLMILIQNYNQMKNQIQIQKINLIQKFKKQSIQKIKMNKINQILLKLLKIKLFNIIIIYRKQRNYRNQQKFKLKGIRIINNLKTI